MNGSIIRPSHRAFVVATLLAFVTSLRAADADAVGNPFARIDVVRVVAHTPGIEREAPFDGKPQGFESRRYPVGGFPDVHASVSGRLADGTWVLVVPFEPDGAAMIYRAVDGRPSPVGVLVAPTGRIDVAVRGGTIEERFAVYPPGESSCAGAGREIRLYAIRDGALERIARRIVPATPRPWLDSVLPRRAGGARADDLAMRTAGLYRRCDRDGGARAIYFGDGIDLFGLPYPPEAVTLSSGSVRLTVLPFVSGGSGGVFTAGVYRVDTGRALLVRTLRTNGHMTMRARGDALEVASPVLVANEGNCCYSHVDVTSYRWNGARGTLVPVATRRMPSGVWNREYGVRRSARR